MSITPQKNRTEAISFCTACREVFNKTCNKDISKKLKENLPLPLPKQHKKCTELVSIFLFSCPFCHYCDTFYFYCYYELQKKSLFWTVNIHLHLFITFSDIFPSFLHFCAFIWDKFPSAGRTLCFLQRRCATDKVFSIFLSENIFILLSFVSKIFY